MDQTKDISMVDILETGFNREISINESSPKLDALQQQYLIDIFSFDNFILLGDPGLGKTFSFKNAAKYENAIYQTVEQFRVTRGKNCKGKTLYLDGLDEYRSRNSDTTLIYDLIDIINEVEPARIRISCRSAEWLGAADLSKFKALFNSNYAVGTLLPLSTEQQTILLIKEGISDVASFFNESEKHGLDNLLGNPQTLIMIASVVKNGEWPESKVQLFEKSSALLLAEHDSNRTRSGAGEFNAQELMDAAGAICASILISNTHNISLLGQPQDPHIPSYRDVSFCEDKKLLAALTRRAFTSSDIKNESLTYVHRTIAEYLAAKWIAKNINDNGLPVIRLKKMLGYKGAPSSELRGLHAWLAIFINDDIAHLFINSDPLGVVLYSDPSILSPSNKITLIKALENLSKEDPWFRWQNWSNKNLGSFSSEELADTFIEILLNPESSYHLKNLILGALQYGKPLLRISDKLIEFLNCDYSTIEEKINTVYILSLMGDEQRDYLATDFYLKVKEDTKKYRKLQIALVKALYPNHLFADEFSNLIVNIACSNDDDARGQIWDLDRVIKVDDLAEIIDQIQEKLTKNEDNITDDSVYDVRDFIKSILKQALDNNSFSTSEQLWCWLKLLYRLPKHNSHQLRDESILKWISDNTDIVDSIFSYSLSLYENPYKWHRHFNGIFGFPYTDDDLILNSLKLLTKKKYPPEISLDFYSYISNLIFNSTSSIQDKAFDIWFEFADKNLEFIERRQTLLSCLLDSWEYKDALDNKKWSLKQEEKKKEAINNIELTIDQIKKGEHLHNIGYLADEYFRDIKSGTKPVDTLKEKYGEDLLSDILLGFQSILSRDDFPTPENISKSKGRYYRWWRAILAAINETYEKNKSLKNISPEILATGYSLSKLFSVFQTIENGSKSQFTLGWIYDYRKNKNNHYRKLLIKLIDSEIRLKIQYPSYLDELKFKEETEVWREEEAFTLLSKYSNTNENTLLELLSIIITNKLFSNNLSSLAKKVLSKNGYLKGEKRTIWLTVGFLLSPEYFSQKLFNYCKTRDFTIWTIQSLSNDFLKDINITGNILNELQLETLIICCGIHFENVNHPSGDWSGNRNKWDAADFIKNMINQLSSIPTKESTLALRKLSKNKLLSSYHEYSLHSLANQKRSYAEKYYRQPDWNETLSILSNKVPANNTDLLALVHDHLITIQRELIGSNTDLHKRFWRHGKKGAMLEPDIEDLCRDRLLEILRPRLSSFELNTEREADMANHKRADIIVQNSRLKLPLELKRDIHSEVWGATQTQLKRRYTIDPNACGYGIFVVFWFGENQKGSVPTPPKGISSPVTANDMEKSLNNLISETDRGKIEVIVLDCSLS